MASLDTAKLMVTGPSPRGWHRLQLAAECLQKYAWTYEGKSGESRRKTSPALVRGSLLHLALAQHYARIRDGESEWVEPVEAVQLVAAVEGHDPQVVESIISTYRAYAEHYAAEDLNYRVMHVEDLLDMQIEQYRLTGRLDLVVEDLGGRIWVLDHKTTGRITSAHKQFYAISGQLLGYSHMARRAYGSRFAGLIINLVQVGGDHKFERVVLPRSLQLENRFEQIVVDLERSIERVRAEERDVADWPKAASELVCYHRYGACEFIDWCRHGQGSAKAGNWSFQP